MPMPLCLAPTPRRFTGWAVYRSNTHNTPVPIRPTGLLSAEKRIGAAAHTNRYTARAAFLAPCPKKTPRANTQREALPCFVAEGRPSSPRQALGTLAQRCAFFSGPGCRCELLFLAGPVSQCIVYIFGLCYIVRPAAPMLG